MKIKMFENWMEKDSKYELKSNVKFPEKGIIMFHHVEELTALTEFLTSNGYSDIWDSYETMSKRMKNDKLAIAIRWGWSAKQGKNFVFIQEGWGSLTHITEFQKFSEFFKFKYEYRGHNLKNYGV